MVSDHLRATEEVEKKNTLVMEVFTGDDITV